MNCLAVTVYLLCCCVMLVYWAEAQTCFEYVCEFKLVVTEFRSMTFKNKHDGNV